MLDENENEIDDFSITEDEGFLQELTEEICLTKLAIYTLV